MKQKIVGGLLRNTQIKFANFLGSKGWSFNFKKKKQGDAKQEVLT